MRANGSGKTTAKHSSGASRDQGRARRNRANRKRVPAGVPPGYPSTSARSVLGRVLKYGEKGFGVCSALRGTGDGRVKARVPGGRVALAFLLLLLSRLGSLNALEQRSPPAAYARWLGGPLPSADVMGDVLALMKLEPLRELLRRQHGRLKRNKGFPRIEGFRFLVLDGHEGVSSYKRSWKECLERTVHFARGDKTQYYHRYVAAYLTNGRQFLMLDAERQLPGEGEIACAIRLLTRLLDCCPRAFDVVCGDNLYMDPGLWKLVRRHNKHLIAVLKNENRDLLADARGLFETTAAVVLDDNKVRRQCWDIEGFTTWPQCGESVRVVRSVEKTTVKRQHDSEEETLLSEWFWVTSLPRAQASTQLIVRAGHGRWGIENQGFNELSNQWHGDHAHKYHAHALLAGTLLLFVAYNLFHAFVERNLKPDVRVGRTQKYWGDLIAADFATAFHSHARAKPT